MAVCYVKDVYWWKSEEKLPDTSRIVLVRGGIAEYCDGIWYTQTGQDHGRPISWNVEYWAELPQAPNA